MATVNFSDLQAASSASNNSQVLVRLDNSLSGADGFRRVSVFNFGKSLNVNSTVASNSATNWNYQGTDIKVLTGNWQNTYTVYATSSAALNSLFTTVQTNSATTWNYQGSDIKALTGNWQNTYNTVQTNSATNWRGLTIFTQVSSSSITSPNSSIPVHGLSAISLSSSVDFAIIPTLSGALLAQIPDNTIVNGNKRGLYATDWQRNHTDPTQVASGNFSTIGGGSSNTASGNFFNSWWW